MLKKIFRPRKSSIIDDLPNRVVVVGAGMVGSSTAFALMMQGVASEIVLIDVNKDKSLGEASDLEHGVSFVPEVKIWAGDYNDCDGAKVVIITAGIAQKQGQTRLELAETNAKIVTEIVRNIRKHTKDAVILMVTNPLDVMTYVALKTLDFPLIRFLAPAQLLTPRGSDTSYHPN